MAKKEKIVIKDEELIPTTIGFIDKRQAGLIYLIFMFIILVGFVYFIPEITEFIENYGSAEVLEEETNLDLTYVSGMEIIGDDVTLSNIILTDYTLTFDIVNNSDTSVNLENDNMYLEIYDGEDNLISRINFSNIVIDINETYSYSVDLLHDDISYFAFDRILENDYPEVTLNVDEDGIENLVCIKDDIIITYEFENQDLVFITNKTFVDEESLIDYESLVDEYNQFSGINAVLEEEFENYFIYTVDLVDFDSDFSVESYIYPYKESAKIIKFEMISEGFDCN